MIAMFFILTSTHVFQTDKQTSKNEEGSEEETKSLVNSETSV